MKNLFIVLSISLLIASCSKENSNSSTNNTSSYLKSMIINSAKSDIDLEFASYYSETENKFLSFLNAAYFADKKTEAIVTFNDIVISKLENHYVNSPYFNKNSTSGYEEASLKAIGNTGVFKVTNSSTINDFSSDIYIPIAIQPTISYTNEGIKMAWNIDSKIDNDVFGVMVNYTPANDNSKDIVKYYKFSQKTGNAMIPISDLQDVPYQGKINLTYARGVYFDKKIDEKLVRTFSYTYGDASVFKD
ncbi:MAG: hypothetical protein MUF43_11270 [Flavobacterium sp.]|jgi:hypothetical protein|nr:hypothetical protein [Flavobacterium sp.]